MPGATTDLATRLSIVPAVPADGILIAIVLQPPGTSREAPEHVVNGNTALPV